MTPGLSWVAAYVELAGAPRMSWTPPSGWHDAMPGDGRALLISEKGRLLGTMKALHLEHSVVRIAYREPLGFVARVHDHDPTTPSTTSTFELRVGVARATQLIHSQANQHLSWRAFVPVQPLAPLHLRALREGPMNFIPD